MQVPFAEVMALRVALDSQCEPIERVLCEKLKLRQDLQEELERLKALEELDSPKRRGDRPFVIILAAVIIASAKKVEAARLARKGKPEFRNVGQRQSEKDRRKFASALEKADRALKSAHKPFRDGLASLELGDLRSILERALEGVLALDLSGVPAHRGRPDYSLSAQPQRTLTSILATVYRVLSGECPKPSEKRYGFYTFTGAMFEAMGMEPPSRYIVRAACESAAKKQAKEHTFPHENESRIYVSLLLSLAMVEYLPAKPGL